MLSFDLTWSGSIISARSFSDILRMEAAMDLALIMDLAERLLFSATELACLCLLLLISCCLTSWTSKSISLARVWEGRRRRGRKREEKRMMKWMWKNKRDSAARQMNKWNWSSLHQRGLVHYGGILSLTKSDSLRFCLTFPCRSVDLRVCCPVDWKLREHGFDIKHTLSFSEISTGRESRFGEGERWSAMKIQPFIYLFAFWNVLQYNRAA